MKASQNAMLGLMFLVFNLGLNPPATAQAAGDVIGAYSCSNAVDRPQNLYLLPDNRWDLTAPFSSRAMTWIKVQTRGWSGRLLYQLDPPGIFKVESGQVRLYNEELVDDWSLGCFGSCRPQRRFLKGLERPSALLPPQKVWATMLIRTFQIDAKSGELTEVLPAGSPQRPMSCERRPLFAPRTPTRAVTSY